MSRGGGAFSLPGAGFSLWPETIRTIREIAGMETEFPMEPKFLFSITVNFRGEYLMTEWFDRSLSRSGRVYWMDGRWPQ